MSSPLQSPALNVGYLALSESEDESESRKRGGSEDDERTLIDDDPDEVPVPWSEEFGYLLSLSWPVALSSVARMLVYSTDTAMVGHLGTPQLNGISLAQSFNQIVGVIGWAPAYVLNCICSQAIGAGNPKLAGNWLQLSLVLCVISALLVCSAYTLMKPSISAFYKDQDDRCGSNSTSHSTSDVISYAVEYQRYAWMIYTPTLIYMALRQYFQAIHVVRPASVVSVVTIGVNLGLNYVLVFGIGSSVSGLGLKGSPLATLFSMLFQIALFVSYAIVWKRYHVPFWGGWSMDSLRSDRVCKFMALCAPMAVGIALENWGYSVLTLLSGRICDDSSVSTNAIYYQIWGIIWSLYWGFGLALQTRVGRHLGAGRIVSAKRVIQLSALIVAIVVLSIGSILLALRSHVGRAFSSDRDVLDLVSKNMYILVINYVASCASLCAVNVLEGIGRTVVLATIQGVGTWLFQIPLAIYFGFYCSAFDNDRLLGLWTGMAVGESTKALSGWYALAATDWTTQVRLAKQRNEHELGSGSACSSRK